MKRILVVDDNLAILKQIAAQLATDYEVSLAKSGLLALQICIQEKPDLILLDIEMPDLNGFDVIARIKQNPCLDRIPVIFLTANRDAATEIRALEAGASDFIVKPAEKIILLHRLELHLRFAAYQAQAGQAVMNLSDGIAASFAELIECRDEQSSGHIQRVSRYFELMGRELIAMGCFAEELVASELQMMIRAAALHDIGKIAISDRILLKAGRFDDLEFSLMKRHAEIGSAILERIYRRMPAQQYLRYACLIALSHHERFDGKGYPHGIAGSKIPLCGRIMAVADVYDALMENRVYRGRMGHNQARDIIYEGGGSHFDPHIVEAFRRIENQLIETIEGTIV